ncbi:MAG: sugar phosphate isomerase/epimerase family protein [Clostridia bacterium]|nr:sugar phosphate isomerase/epimerase family protein [Clostridia bacterium]
MKEFRLALSTANASPATAPILLNGSVVENLRRAAALGYDAIEVHIRENDAFDEVGILRAAAECSVEVAQIITGRLNTEGRCSLTDDRPYVVEAALRGMERYINMAASVGADLVIGWIRGTVPPGKDRCVYIQRLAECMRLLNSKSRTVGVKLNIEVINRYETNIFNTCEETIDFIEKYGLDNCFVHLDTFHMNIEEADMAQAIRRARGLLNYIHFADNQRRYVGSGSIDFEGVIQALRDIGYEGIISVECLPVPDAETAARASINRIRQYLR